LQSQAATLLVGAIGTVVVLTRGRLALLASLAALGALATNIMLPAFPQMARELGVAPQQRAWTLSGFFVVFAIGRLFVGPLSDARGRAPFIIGGPSLWQRHLCARAIAPDLIAGRAVQPFMLVRLRFWPVLSRAIFITDTSSTWLWRFEKFMEIAPGKEWCR
jgi:MFS family permease